MHRHPNLTNRLLGVGVVTATLLLAGCGSDGSGNSASATIDATVVDSTNATADGELTVSPDRALAGIVRDPAPVVDDTVLPLLGTPGEDATFRAEPGGLQAVYFGYTNCPDVCPTTMSDWAVTLRRLPDEVAAHVQTLMVTVDPERDNEILTGYVESFVPDAEAAGTTDAALLAAAAEPFGASYGVTTSAQGDIEVAHSGFLYLVDDQGRLVVSWPFGTDSKEMAADVLQLFDAQAAAS